MMFIACIICMFILHIRLQKLEELQIKTADLLLEIVDEMEKHGVK